jgi:secreted trypsin-like serine protease
LNSPAHHVEVGARRDCRQSALDGQVTPESIEHYVDWAQDCVESLSRDDLKPLKIIKDGAHRPDRGISGVAGAPTMMQETIKIVSSQIRRGHAVAQEPIAQIGQNLHL